MDQYSGRQKAKEDEADFGSCRLLTFPPKLSKDIPGEKADIEQVEAEVSVEELADPLPLEPEEAGDHWVAQKMSMLLGLAHVPKALCLGQSRYIFSRLPTLVFVLLVVNLFKPSPAS